MGMHGRPRRRGFSLADDLTRLEGVFREIGNVALVIIDPITAYLGAVDSHRNAEVRAPLAPLADLAARHGAAVLAISHLRKSDAGDVVLRVIGDRPAPQRSAAELLLADMLAAGPVPVAELQAEAQAAGHSWGTVRRASDALGVISRRLGGLDCTGAWAWALPYAAGDADDAEIPPESEAEL
jgi:AAA domain